VRLWTSNTIGENQLQAFHADQMGIETLTNFMWGRQATDWMLPIMWSVARKYEKGVFAEIGTRSGVSTTMFALAARDVGGKVYTIDISDEDANEAAHNLGVSGLSGFVRMMRGDSRTTDFPEPIDVLFIDGDHSYEGVKADFERHEPNVKDDGVIFFHDPCSVPGVGRFLEEMGIFHIPIEAGLGIYCKGPHHPWGEVRQVA